MSQLLLENNPLRCVCGDPVETSFFEATDEYEDFHHVCCRKCGNNATGDTLADAEMDFHLLYIDPEPPNVLDQAIDFACINGCPGNVSVSRVERAAREYTLPPLLMRYSKPLGCILVDTATDDDCIAGRRANYCSLVLFHPVWWREAWSIARRLRHSHAGCAAIVTSSEMQEGIFLALSPNHAVCINGQLRS